MARRHLVDMSDGAEPVTKSRLASERTKRRKALGVKPTVRGGGPPAEASVTRSRIAQGLPARVEDTATLARVAQLLQQTQQENTR